MRKGYGWSKGPLEAADLAGLHIIRAAMNFIWEETGSPIFHPPESLTRLIEEGHLGRKTGIGFYKYRQRIKGIKIYGKSWNLFNRQPRHKWMWY